MTQVQQLQARIDAIRDTGGSTAGWDSFALSDIAEAQRLLKEASTLFHDARKCTHSVAKSTVLFNAMLALQEAESLIEVWEVED